MYPLCRNLFRPYPDVYYFHIHAEENRATNDSSVPHCDDKCYKSTSYACCYARLFRSLTISGKQGQKNDYRTIEHIAWKQWQVAEYDVPLFADSRTFRNWKYDFLRPTHLSRGYNQPLSSQLPHKPTHTFSSSRLAAYIGTRDNTVLAFWHIGLLS